MISKKYVIDNYPIDLLMGSGQDSLLTKRTQG